MSDNILPTENENAASTTEVYQEDKGLKQKFFSTRGRLNRKRYFIRVFCVLGVSFIIGYVILAVANYVLKPYVGTKVGEIIMYISLGSLALLSLIAVISLLHLSIKRLHDTNNSGRQMLLNLPLFILYAVMVGGDLINRNPNMNLTLFFFFFIILPIIPITGLNVLILGIKKGTEGHNQYGADPLVNSVNNA